jgi:hypothetical protein
VTALAANESRVDQPARKARVIPDANLATVHINEVGLQVSAAEQDEDIVGLARIVERYAGRIDAGFRPEGRRPQEGGEKTHSEREVAFFHDLENPRDSNYSASPIMAVKVRSARQSGVGKADDDGG